jgi:Uma2 family endonuclease
MALLLQEPGFLNRAMPISLRTWHWMIEQGLAPKRAELLRGVIVEKMSKSILHIQLANRMFLLLVEALASRFWVRQEAPITTQDSEPEPDVSVVAGRDADYAQHPTTAKLVVEVSVTTLAEDREMALIYAEAGVEEYWIVMATERCIEVHRSPLGGRYQETRTHSAGESFACRSLPGVTIDVAELFAGLPV